MQLHCYVSATITTAESLGPAAAESQHTLGRHQPARGQRSEIEHPHFVGNGAVNAAPDDSEHTQRQSPAVLGAPRDAATPAQERGAFTCASGHHYPTSAPYAITPLS